MAFYDVRRSQSGPFIRLDGRCSDLRLFLDAVNTVIKLVSQHYETQSTGRKTQWHTGRLVKNKEKSTKPS